MKSKSNSIFYGMIAVLIISAAFIYSWKFLVPSYYSQRNELSNINDELKAATTKLESIKTTESTLRGLKDITSQLFVAVPGDKDSPNLITELEAIAVKNKLIIPEIQIIDKGNNVNQSSNGVPISLSLTGSFDNLNAFIVDLEKDIRFINIKSFSIVSDKEDPGKMSLSLQLEAYKRSKNVAPTTAAASTAAEDTLGGGQ